MTVFPAVNPNVVTRAPSHTPSCVCGNDWRFETVDLSSGQLIGLLHPISAQWEERHSTPGVATITVKSRDLSAVQVWPHDVGLYISQIVDGDRVGRWAGLIEEYDAQGQGAAQIGVQSIDEYLFHRNVADANSGIQRTFTQVTQAQIAKDLTDLAVQLDGINIVGVAGTSSQVRDRVYESWELANIGQAIKDLTEGVNGVEYKLDHVYGNGFWQTRITFQDTIGANRGVHLRGGDHEGSTFGVKVSAKDHATYVYMVGEGTEQAQKLSVAYDASNIYPRFHAVPPKIDVADQLTLDQYAQGYVADHRDPVATPELTLPGLHPVPEQLQLGDIVRVSFSDGGLATFDGDARVMSIGWTLQDGSPVTRACTFQTVTRSSTALRVLVNNGPGQDVPAPAAGSVSNLQDSRIVRPAGLAHSEEF